MNNNLDQTIKRTRQYWYVDGLAEIAFGGLCLLLGLYFFSKATMSAQSPIGFVLDIGFVVLVVGYGFLAGRILKAMKMWLTYPRTGYVSYPRSKGNRRRTTFIIGAIIAASLVVIFGTGLASSDWIPAINGLLIGGAWLFVAYKIGLPRFYAMALLSVFLGMVISIASLGDMLGLAVYYLATSLIILVFGGFALFTYLRDTQPPQITPSLDRPATKENTP
jgi:hypothetical protein